MRRYRHGPNLRSQVPLHSDEIEVALERRIVRTEPTKVVEADWHVGNNSFFNFQLKKKKGSRQVQFLYMSYQGEGQAPLLPKSTASN